MLSIVAFSLLLPGFRWSASSARVQDDCIVFDETLKAVCGNLLSYWRYHDGRTFALYTLTGVATTLVFWGFEFGFDHIFASKAMRYLGAVIGLAIGYFMRTSVS